MSVNVQLLRPTEKEDKPSAAASLPAEPGSERRTPLALDGMVREEINRLVQRVFLLPGADSPHAVVFAGVESGVGSSWICAHAGEVLASQVAGSVCLVDANLRSPSLHTYFKTDNARGLSDALRQPGAVRDFAQRLPGGNLWLLTCGLLRSDSNALIASDVLGMRMTELRAKFDYVLIDAPAVGLCADALLLGRMSEGVVMVLEAHRTRRETARRAKAILDAARVRVLGAVLNKRTFPIPASLYQKI